MTGLPEPFMILSALTSALPDSVFVSTCGYISRDLHKASDRPGHFYLVGSMGAALPMSLAVALCRANRRVIAIDGDGSFFMGLASLPMVGRAHPENLVHLVLDNGVHESTGGQRTLSAAVGSSIVPLMVAAGYDSAESTTSVERIIANARDTHGPVGIHVNVGRRNEVSPRVIPAPEELVNRTREFLHRSDI